jgi:hypothetical protein
MTHRQPLRLAAVAIVAGLFSASAVQAAPYRPGFGVPRAAVKTAFFADGRKIMLAVDGGRATQFFIKGVDYAPSPICSGPLDNPIGDANKAIWERDLPNLRALNTNAVKVYNVDLNVGPIDQFLTRAYNNGTRPIYVVLSIYFQGAAVLNKDAAADLGRQYERLMQTYGTFPAVLGVSISSEVNAEDLVKDPAFWAGMNTVVAGARRGLAAANARKIVTTSMVDGYDGDTKIWNPITYGERNGFNIDAWGINVYRGASFSKAHLWEQVNSYTTKPFLLGEWGTPESWHPNGDPNVAVEWPPGKIGLLTSYIRGLDQDLYQNSTVNGGVNSGGFYFEYSDEWWKAERGNNCEHLPNGVPNGNFPGGFNDEGWYGLNSIKAGVGNKPNVLSKRDPFFTLQTDFSQQ